MQTDVSRRHVIIQSVTSAVAWQHDELVVDSSEKLISLYHVSQCHRYQYGHYLLIVSVANCRYPTFTRKITMCYKFAVCFSILMFMPSLAEGSVDRCESDALLCL